MIIKVAILCNSGISASHLAHLLNKYCQKNHIIYQISATSFLDTIGYQTADLILLSPAIRKYYDFVQSKSVDSNLGQHIIRMGDYGVMDAEKIIGHINELVEPLKMS